MTIENFTPLPAVTGGVLIGLASVWLLVANGRIAGVSGILHGLFAGPAGSAPGGRAGDRLWRAWFIAGLVVAGFAWHAFAGPASVRQGFGLGWVALAGLLVGFGTRMSGGCTSGHGVCGLGRLSLRSLVAVAIFMAAGMAAPPSSCATCSGCRRDRPRGRARRRPLVRHRLVDLRNGDAAQSARLSRCHRLVGPEPRAGHGRRGRRHARRLSGRIETSSH